MSVDKHISHLIVLFLEGELTPAGREELDRWLDERPENREWFEGFVGKDRFRNRAAAYLAYDVESGWERLENQRARRERRRVWRKVLGYAAMVLPLVVGSLFWLIQDGKEEKAEMLAVAGRNQAILLTDRGEKILLTGVHDSCLNLVGDQRVTVGKDGRIVYQDSTRLERQKMHWHTLAVPQGGEYKLELDEGTVVCLNAGTCLRYPARFAADRREVFLDGEAFFEVARMDDKPFVVHVNELEIKVYGTAFNVNTLCPGLVKTTLVNGKVGVRVKATGEEVILRPDQMAEYNTADSRMEVRTVDTYAQIAWRYGEFVFCEESLESIMDRFSLWYDIEVFYEKEALKEKCFTGIISRFADVEDALSLIEGTASVHFGCKGKTVIVRE